MCGTFVMLAVGCSERTDYAEGDGADAYSSSDGGFDSLDVNTRLVLPEPKDSDSLIRNDNDIENKIDANQQAVDLKEITTDSSVDSLYGNASYEPGDDLPPIRGTINEDDYFVVGEDTTPTMVYGFN